MERQRASSRPSHRASPASLPAAPNDICAAKRMAARPVRRHRDGHCLTGSSGSERQGGGRRAEHSTLMALREEAKMLSGIIKGNQGRSMEMEEAKMLSGIIKGNQGQSRGIEGD
jgi:hypothetical protein